MKIALLDVTVTMSYGGIQTALWELSRALHDKGHEVAVIGGDGAVRPNLDGRDISVHTFPYTARSTVINLGNRFRRLWERISFALNARKAVVEANYDWIVITKPYDFFWPSLMPSSSKTRFAFRSGGTSFVWADRYFSRQIDAFFANSYFNAWQIKSRFGRFPMVIYNGVDLERFGPHRRSDERRKQLGLGDNDLLAIYAGRLVGWKGLVYSIRALAKAKSVGISLKFLIIGDGPEEKVLRKLAERLGVSERIIFHPAMSHDELPIWWASADIGMFASIGDEGFSNSVAEALASGLPVIATAFSGNPETVGNEETCGYLVPPEDVDAIAEKLELLVVSPELRRAMGGAARRRIEANFTWERVAQRLLDGLESVSSEKSTSKRRYP